MNQGVREVTNKIAKTLNNHLLLPCLVDKQAFKHGREYLPDLYSLQQLPLWIVEKATR